MKKNLFAEKTIAGRLFIRVVCAILVCLLLAGCSGKTDATDSEEMYSDLSGASSKIPVSSASSGSPVSSNGEGNTVTNTEQREPLVKKPEFDKADAVNGFYANKVDADFSGLVGLFEGKNVQYTMKSTSIGGKLNMHFADFLQVGDQIWAYYIKWEKHGEQKKGCIALAKSDDGIQFTDCGTVLHASDSGWDSRMATFPGIWYEDSTYYLVYEGAGDNNGAIGLATSKDGVNFEKYGENGMILNYSGEGHEAVNIGTPDLVRVNGVWYLTYHSYDGVDCQLCIAYGTDLANLKKYEHNPLIPTSRTGNDSGTVGRRDLIYYDGWFYMVYEISSDPPYETAKWGHKFARSKDLSNWETVDSPYPITSKGMGNDGPAFVVLNGRLWVYFREPGNVLGRYTLII